jgi:hypothetical protein
MSANLQQVALAVTVPQVLLVLGSHDWRLLQMSPR